MQMNPKDFYYKFVKPNYDEFCSDAGDVRKAYNAIISLCHMADNYFNYYDRKNDARISSYIISQNKKENFKAFKIDLGKRSSYFNDVQSMANVYKHLYTGSGKAHVTVNSAGAVFVNEAEQNDDVVNDVVQSDDLNKEHWSTVYYKKNDGSCEEVKDALSEVIKMWGGILDVLKK